MVQAYPESDFIRVWITIGLVLFLLGLSMGIWRSDEMKNQVFKSTFLMKGLSSLFLLVLIAPTNSSY